MAVPYVQGDRMLAMHHCPTHWESTDKGNPGCNHNEAEDWQIRGTGHSGRAGAAVRWGVDLDVP